jgi:hypothetical protein
MDQPDQELVDTILSMTIATAGGDDEAVEVFLRAHAPEELALAGTYVIWCMAAALGQKLDPPRSALQMIHVMAQALRDTDDVGN